MNMPDAAADLLDAALCRNKSNAQLVVEFCPQVNKSMVYMQI